MLAAQFRNVQSGLGLYCLFFALSMAFHVVRRLNGNENNKLSETGSGPEQTGTGNEAKVKTGSGEKSIVVQLAQKYVTSAAENHAIPETPRLYILAISFHSM